MDQERFATEPVRLASRNLEQLLGKNWSCDADRLGGEKRDPDCSASRPLHESGCQLFHVFLKSANLRFKFSKFEANLHSVESNS